MIDDWLDNGTIDKQYKPACYQQALKHVPEDLRDYSNITDAISAALSATLRGDTPTNNATGGGTTPGNGTNSGPNRTPQGGVPPQSIYDQGLNKLGTTKASSVPIPLLVLAALGALLLISAGGLTVGKRIKARRPTPPR